MRSQDGSSHTNVKPQPCWPYNTFNKSNSGILTVNDGTSQGYVPLLIFKNVAVEALKNV
jgi:hypothetical protein